MFIDNMPQHCTVGNIKTHLDLLRVNSSLKLAFNIVEVISFIYSCNEVERGSWYTTGIALRSLLLLVISKCSV